MKFTDFLFSVLMLICCISCQSEEVKEQEDTRSNQFAENFNITELDDYKIVEVNNLLDNSNDSYKYVLYKNERLIDISPLYAMKQLRYLDITDCNVPEYQINELMNNNPDITIYHKSLAKR